MSQQPTRSPAGPGGPRGPRPPASPYSTVTRTQVPNNQTDEKKRRDTPIQIPLR